MANIHTQILLECTESRTLRDGEYLNTFKAKVGGQKVEVTMDCPAVPGMFYSIMLRGMFTFREDTSRECVADLLRFSVGSGTLEGSDWLEHLRELEEKKRERR